MYVVVNKHGEVFTGLIKGSIQWSYDWSQAKPLFKENTSRLLEENFGAELVKEEEIIRKMKVLLMMKFIIEF